MKTKIRITGQVAGNFRLKTRLSLTAEGCESWFNDFLLTFRTKKDAIKALSAAFRDLKELEPDFYRDGGIKYFRGSRLFYDASTARILE